MLEAALVASVDHGPHAPSIAIARMAVTCGVDLNNAMASGINVLGDVHGGAGPAVHGAVRSRSALLPRSDAGSREPSIDSRSTRSSPRTARSFRASAIAFIRSIRASRRCSALVEQARSVQASCPAGYARIGSEVEAALRRRTGKPIPMNIDGVTAVIFCELGFPPPMGRGLFILSRSVGILAHAWEQMQRNERIKGPMPKEIPYTYSGPASDARSTLDSTSRIASSQRFAMKDFVATLLVKYLEARGVEHIFGLCGHTNIAVLAALGEQLDSLRQHASRADRRACRRRLCARQREDRRGAESSRARPHERGDRRGQRGARFDSDGRDRRRCAESLLRQASASGSEHACGRVAVRDLSSVRETRLARGSAGSVARDRRQGIPSGGERSSGPGAHLRADGYFLCRSSMRRCSSASRRTRSRIRSRRSTTRPRERIVNDAARVRASRCCTSAAAFCSRTRPKELRDFVDHLGIPVAHSLMGKGALPDDHPLTLGMTGFWGTKYINDSCRDADYILALGTRFCEADCSSWEGEYTFNIPPTKLIHIDIDPAEIGRNYPVEIGVVADLKQALTVLNRVARELLPQPRLNEPLRQEIAEYRKQFKSKQRGRGGERISSRCDRSASSLTCARCCRATRSSRPMLAGTRTASASSFRSTSPARF